MDAMLTVRFGSFTVEESARLMSECAERSVFAEPSVYRSFEEVVQFTDRGGENGGPGGGGQEEQERGATGAGREGNGAGSSASGKPAAAWTVSARSWDKRKCQDVFAWNSTRLHSLASTEYVPHGLYNYGNTCFLNSVLHALFACRDVRSFLRELEGESFPGDVAPVLESLVEFSKSVVVGTSDEDLARQGQTLASVSTSRGATFYPTVFEKITERFCNLTSGPGFDTPASLPQQDAQEFLLHVLDQLHEEMIALRKKAIEEVGDASEEGGARGSQGNGGASPAPAEDWEEVGKNNKSSVTRRHTEVLNEGRKSRITSIFGGLLRSTVRAEGSKPSVCIEPFTFLQLDISSDEVEGVAEAMQRFSVPEYLDDYCVGGVASKTVQIEKPPLVMVVQLMRFSYTSSGHSIKLTKSCKIPDSLVVGKDTLVGGPPVEYELFATISHHGNSLQSGHYTACVKDLNKRWFHCDDDEIWEMNGSGLEDGSSDTYLVLYRKKENV
ncbi:ubiquitin carboxyl-terminal hydrolase [Chloropicon primus]|uniref:ubiquitinyl hydrolase 1 n=3 Tax=Chloropicon primus TaxID=1764295 RepID=A0A5B8ME86_9CHLO|nr:ubiquitin carboxyl-terminal hydrolase [Chloropicon primus]UPQ97180.1 ubiquitin carboxyl-terminal hydrolase [Chloropicon primus]|eukprot:QDZ17965.1 ubiquitin carboxyl-terminal hydrolase [Chloropicon primus]